MTVSVGWGRSRQEVLISSTCTYTLAAHSKALAVVRKEGAPACHGYRVLRDGKDAAWDWYVYRPDKVTQASPDAPAQVTSFYRFYLPRRSGAQDAEIEVDQSRLAGGMPAGSGFPTLWTVWVSAPKWAFRDIRGPVQAQSANAVAWRVEAAPESSAKTTAVARSVSLSRFVETTKPPSTRRQTRGEMLTAFAFAACGIAVVAALLVAGLAGPAVRRRWAVATMVLAAPLCLFALFGVPAPLVPPNMAVGTISATIGSGTPPGSVWEPGPVLGLWLWYVLPVAGWWFSRRAVTGRPPSRWVLLSGCLPPLLAFPLMAAGGDVPGTRIWLGLAAMAVCLPLLPLLLRPLCDGAVRRWLPTAVALLWIVYTIHLLGRSPVMADKDPVVTPFEVAAELVCTWPAAAWLTSLLGPVLRRAPGPAVRGACFLALWGAVLSSYRHPFFTGYAAWPFFVAAACGLALQITYLLRRGAAGDGGRAVEPVGRVLLVCAVLTALGSPSLRTLSMWGEALAVLWAAVLASLVLIPVGASATAAEFRRVGRQAHARFMDRWVTTRLVWDTRADFQRAARTSLAEDMTVPDFTGRWRELAVPGRRGDPAERLARTKHLALGTSAGTAPRTAGLACAGLAQLLALPWALYKLLTSSTVGRDYFMPFHLDVLSKALRFGHWALYGFVFGYFYALLRGRTPTAKAAWLMLVILPAEVLPMVALTADPQYALDPSWGDTLVACGGVAGQTLVVCMGLGLGWESWLARTAGMKWSQVRNFRRLPSITVPVGTVLVAAATTFATAVAGTWAQQLPQPPPGQPSSSATAPPSQSNP
ncbi:hypothetical protein ABZT08_29040 [Streptomyces sp. NPDC005526]|uniref:hypothetical protein n=1 Tax=Streptomyces sp. NPDC005526 TaxID=3156885 RepID=UPI0033A4C423